MTDSPKAHSGKFWLGMVLFQVVFGLAVFGVTREVYKSDPTITAAKPNLNWPVAGQTLSSDLLKGQGMPSKNQGGMAVANNSVGATSDLNALQDPVEISRLANEMFANKNYEKAAQLYEKLLAFAPENADTYNNLGLTLHYVGRSAEALKWLEEGSIIDPSNQRLWLTLGFVSTQMGDTDKARTALTSAVDLGAETQVGQSAAKMLAELP